MPPTLPTSQPVTPTDLTEGSWRRRIAALARLPVGEPPDPELLPALVGLLTAPESSQREEVVAVVVRAGAPVVPHLLSALSDGPTETPESRRAVVVALERLGAAAGPAIPLLGTLLDDPWLGPCVESALAAIVDERAGGSGWPHFLGAIVMGLSVLLAWPTSDGVNPLALVLVAVAWSVAIGLWWVRPGAVAWVMLFVAGVAVVLAAAVAGRLAEVFAGLSGALKVG